MYYSFWKKFTYPCSDAMSHLECVIVASPLSFFLKLQILKIRIVHIFQVHSHTNTVFTDWKLPNWVQDRCQPLLRRENLTYLWTKWHLPLPFPSRNKTQKNSYGSPFEQIFPKMKRHLPERLKIMRQWSFWDKKTPASTLAESPPPILLDKLKLPKRIITYHTCR